MKIIDLLILTFFCALIYWLSDQPSLPVPMLFDWQDKLHHMAAYSVMSVLAWRAFRHFISSPLLLGIISIVFCSLYGISDEYHQSFVPGRSSDIWDWAADTLGSALAILFISPLFNRKTLVNQ